MFSKLRHYMIDLSTDQRNDWKEKIIKVILFGASLLYWIGAIIHRDLYRFGILRRYRAPVPLVSVGNVTWGGSGKTPMVHYLAKKMTEKYDVTIVTRGYGQDESLQLSQNLVKANVITGKNRIRSIKAFLKHTDTDVFLTDDGFQHWPLERDLEIVCVNALNPFGNEYLIPRGILREPISALSRAHMVAVMHANMVSDEKLKECLDHITQYVARDNILLCKHEPVGFVRGRTNEALDVQAFQGQKMMAVCGIGAPDTFVKTLESVGVDVSQTFVFGDHHDFQETELKNIRRKVNLAKDISFVTTEKDWVRCPLEMGRSIDPYVLKVKIRILENEDRLTDRLNRLFQR